MSLIYFRIQGTMKGKHLMRSQALRESTSPPRTPSESRPPTTSITTIVVNHAQSNHSNNVSPIPPGTFSPSPSTSANRHPSPKSTQGSTGSASPQEAQQPPSFLDHEFPKLALPKTRPIRNTGSLAVIRLNTTTGESKSNI